MVHGESDYLRGRGGRERRPQGEGGNGGPEPSRQRGPDMPGRSPQANRPEGDSLLPAMDARVSARSPVRKNHTPGAVGGVGSLASLPRRSARREAQPIRQSTWTTSQDTRHNSMLQRHVFPLLVDVLDQVAAGLAWETSIEAWRGSITQEAIAEAVRLAGYDVGRQRKCRSYLCVADGATYQETLANVQIIIAEWIETTQELGAPFRHPQVVCCWRETTTPLS